MVDASTLRDEIDILYAISTRLAQAATPAGWLAAVSGYAQDNGAASGALFYALYDASNTPDSLTIAAEWSRSEHDGARVGVDGARTIMAHWIATPDQPLLISDLQADETFDLGARAAFEAQVVRGLVALPLRHNEQWMGLLVFGWQEPHAFSDGEIFVYHELLQTLPSVVASRRAFLDAEEARAERELLYHASRGINAARTYQDVVDAVSQLEMRALHIALWVWEEFDYDRAQLIELVAKQRDSHWPDGVRLTLDQLPHSRIFDRTQPFVVEDTRERAQLDPVTAATIERHGYRALMAVPLCLEDRFTGLLAFEAEHPRRFTERERRLAAAIGELVTAAVERMRFKDATERGRAQAELLASVNAALSQANDEQAILDAVATVVAPYDVALSILAYSNANEDDPPTEVQTVALRMHRAAEPDTRALPLASQLVQDSPLLRMALDAPDAPIFIEDAWHDVSPAAHAAQPLMRDLAWSALIALPLKSGDLWHGLLLLVWDRPQPFPDDLRALIHAIRPTLAAVVTSRRAYLAQKEAHIEAAQRALELETVAKISAAATSILDLDRLLSTMTALARTSFPSYYLDIFLLNAETNMFACVSEAEQPSPRRIALDDPRALVARAARIRQGVMVNDASIAPEGVLSPGLPEARSEMAVPMIAAKQIVGVLVVQSAEPERFSKGDIRVMSTLADLMAVAVENARLYRAAHELAVFEERSRLARELHDSVSQALYGVALGTRTAQKLLAREPEKVAEPLDYVLSLAEAGLSEMRALIFELRPELLENDGLQAALAAQVASLRARHQIEVDAELCDEPDVSIAMKEALYRIAREALHNTVKHARATHAKVRMDCLPDGIILELADNGLGFDPSNSFPGHLGLKSMRERAQAVGGRFALESAPGEGTRIVVEVRTQS